MNRRLGVLTSTLVAAAVIAAVVAAAALAGAEPFGGSDGTMFGVVVVDRKTGETKAEQNEDEQFRSASLVKLLIALDYLHRRGSDAEIAEIPEEDRELLGSMLRTSDDRAASVLWGQEGQETIVARMVDLLGLEDTEPPADRRTWGYTATSAADVARLYAYLLDEADPEARDFVLGHLRDATRCAVDGRDQYFGIPRSVRAPWAVKQGWSGFGEVPPGEQCTSTPPGAVQPAGADQNRTASSQAPADTGSKPDIDFVREAMHTTGTIGDGNETIMAVLSLHPDGTSYEKAARRVTAVTRALYTAS